MRVKSGTFVGIGTRILASDNPGVTIIPVGAEGTGLSKV